MSDEAFTEAAAELNDLIDPRPQLPNEAVCPYCWVTYNRHLSGCPTCKDLR